MNGRILSLLGVSLFCLSPLGAQPVPLRADGDEALALWSQTATAAQQALKANRQDEAIELAEAAITQARSFGPRDTHLAQALVLRAEVYLWQKDDGRAEAMFQQAVKVCEEAVGPDGRALVHPLSSLANFYYYVQPHYDRVAALFERILAIVERPDRSRDDDVIMWSRNLGTIYEKLGQFARAEPLFARAVALTEKTQPQWTSHELLTQAQFYRSWKKYGRADEIALRALRLRERALAGDASNVDRKLDLSVALDEITAIQLAAGKFDAAETSARRSLTAIESMGDAMHPELGPRLALLGDVLRARGNDREAAETYQRLVTVTEANLGPESAPLANALAKYAAALRRLHRDTEAAAIEARATSMRGKFVSSL